MDDICTVDNSKALQYNMEDQVTNPYISVTDVQSRVLYIYNYVSNNGVIVR